jgi:hypothetical protein
VKADDVLVELDTLVLFETEDDEDAAEAVKTNKLRPTMVRKVLILCIKYYYILQINLAFKFFLVFQIHYF